VPVVSAHFCSLYQGCPAYGLFVCSTVADCAAPTLCRLSKSARRSRQARQRSGRMRYVYLRAADDDHGDNGDDTAPKPAQTVRRVMPSPQDSRIRQVAPTCTTTRTQQRPGADNDDDVEARQLYEWTQNLSVDDWSLVHITWTELVTLMTLLPGPRTLMLLHPRQLNVFIS